MRRLLVPLALAAVLAGCGHDRQPAADPTEVEAPRRFERVEVEEAGMRFRAPANWDLHPRTAPVAFTLSSGTAFVSAYAYEREEPLPDTDAELEAARGRLVREVRERDPDFDLDRARTAEVAGRVAIVLRGRQSLSGRTLETRSVHVFEGDVEYVLEAVAPRESFPVVDRRVLTPLLRSLRLSGRLRNGQG